LDESKRYPETDWYFEYSPESFSSTEIEYSIEVCNAVIDVWQPTPDHKAIFNLPATVECATPNVFADQVETFCDQVHKRESIVVSLHTHNDRGCGVAAAELALMAGADRVEGTLMGNGERTGNMDIVTMAMNLYSQGIDPCLHLANADEIVHTVTECTQIAAHPRHPWLGELVYTAFSGSHQDAIRKCLTQQQDDEPWDVAYLPIDPQDLGRDYQSVIRVNSQSGKGGVAYVLEQDYGLQLPRWLQIEASRKVQAYAEAHSVEVSSEQIWDIVKHSFMHEDKGYQLKTYQIDRQGECENVQATLMSTNEQQQDVTLNGQGDGVLAAFCQAVSQGLGLDIEIIHYDQHAIGTGTDASAMAYVQLKVNGQRYCGIAKNKDTISANLNAILACVHQVNR